MSFGNLKNWLMIPALLLGGILVGLFIPYQQIRDTVANIFELDSKEEEKEDDQPSHMHVEITETAQKSLGLKVRRATIGSYTPTYDIPATIKELPGASSIQFSSRFSGLIKKVFVSEGQSIRAGDRIMEIELTGEELAKAQAELLLAVKKVENLREELARLEPLVQQGGLANKRSLELRYEEKQLQAEIDTRKQELILHGLEEIQVHSITRQKKLVRTVVIHAPQNLLAPQINLPEPSNPGDVTFIVEEIAAKPGTIVESGSDLCHFAYHEMLIVEGHAFERDLSQIRSVFEAKSNITVNVGTFSRHTKIPNCNVAFVSNHANEGSNTYPFYVYLKNENENEAQDTPAYLAWKWKPGQLAHVELPKSTYENMLILPRDAIAENGVSRIVFEWKGQVEHDHEHDEDDDHEHADEYVPIEVDVVYMDQEMAVVSPDGNLKEGTRIAFNNANHLLFSMQSGSGGHGHSHPHPH